MQCEYALRGRVQIEFPFLSCCQGLSDPCQSILTVRWYVGTSTVTEVNLVLVQVLKL